VQSAELQQMATCLRVLCADMVEHAGSGHPGMPMGMADVATLLFKQFLTFDPQQPNWAARDRLVLSAGHGAALAYALLHLVGQESVTLEELKRLRRKDSLTPGHPEFGHTPGIECTTGPLGQGLATSVGMAIAEKKLQAELGSDITKHNIYVIAGDGCLMEGVSHEAAALAGHLELDNLIVLFDDNSISIDGATSLTSSENVAARFEAYGWKAISANGHDFESINSALVQADDEARPVIVSCKTEIGRGSPGKAGTAAIHGSPLGSDEMNGLRADLGWNFPPFDIPNGIKQLWRSIGSDGALARESWLERLEDSPEHIRSRIAQLEGDAPTEIPIATISRLREQAAASTDPIATRVSSQRALEVLVNDCAWLLGGSADLSGSNGTHVSAHSDFSASDRAGNYVRYGVREHAMAAAMNGIALSRAYVPYGGTFLVFSDYCRPSIRLAALMGLKVIYVFTHDSIGLGEDGPTHQPIEHLASLRLIPGLRVFRPADAIEVAECWETALSNQGPSVLALSRQSVPAVRSDISTNRSSEGAYILASGGDSPDVTIYATGSEVHVAVEVREKLARNKIRAEVISVPCMEIADQRNAEELSARNSGLRVAIEAGASLPWRHLVVPNGLVFGIDEFGQSAAGPQLFEHFRITSDAIAEAIKSEIRIREVV